MKFRDLAALIAATGLTRFAFRSHYLYDIDSVNFALALKRFDPAVHQPHPPGYFLYICLGRLANILFHDANAALVAISIVFSCAAAAMIYVLADNWFGRKAAVFAGIVFLCSPLEWFHGTVALTYIVEAFFSALVGYLCWRVYCGAAAFAVPAALVAGVAAGFRPSSLLFLGPLFVFSLRNVPRRQAAAALGALALTVLAWFIPMILISGPKAYISSLLLLWTTVPAKGSAFNSSIVNSVARLFVVVGAYLLCFGCASILPIIQPMIQPLTARPRNSGARMRVFTCVWLGPGLLFFVLVFLRFVNSGYLLILTPPLCAWMGLWAADWYAAAGASPALKKAMIAGCAAVNIAIFLFAPVYCSYREVRQFERELAGIIQALPQVGLPDETLIVGLDSHFLGYRHAGYYLPGYLTVEYPEVRFTSGVRVFAMRRRNTELQARLATPSARNFVFFPLPANDPEYTSYMAELLKRFPPGDLRSIRRGGTEFIVGPVRDLVCLFPLAAGKSL